MVFAQANGSIAFAQIDLMYVFIFFSFSFCFEVEQSSKAACDLGLAYEGNVPSSFPKA